LGVVADVGAVVVVRAAASFCYCNNNVLKLD
jgi:hypothetical protein